MADSKRQTIAAALKARLAFGGSGYVNSFDADHVKPWLQEVPGDDDLPFISFRDLEEPQQPDATEQMEATLQVKILAVVQGSGSPTTPEAVAAQARSLLADIIKACGTDETWGVESAWSEIKSTNIDVTGGERLTAWAEVTLEIHYPYQRWDYTQ